MCLCVFYHTAILLFRTIWIAKVGLSGPLLATVEVILLPPTFARTTMACKLHFKLLHVSFGSSLEWGVSRALPEKRETMGGGCMLLLRPLKYSRLSGISRLFSWAVSPESPRGMEGRLSSVGPNTWAGQLGRRWEEWGRRLLFRVTRPGLGTSGK